EGTTAVKPVANTASTPQEGATAVKPVEGWSIQDALPGLFGSTTNPKNATSDVQNSASPSDLQIQEEMRALSKMQEEMKNVIDEQNELARKAIERIKKGQ